MVEYEAVIGLEVHAQLKTRSKIFCGCPTTFGADANENVCPVCLGMPGVLPVLNKRAVEHGIKCGIALNCSIAETTKFDRKNYFYPDLPKGYQISQYDQPICSNGHLTIDGRKIRILRAHLEEDAGKLVHAGADGLHGSDYSKPDFNRAGVPLLEIVSEPDIRDAEHARRYLTELRTILRYLDVCDGDLEKGNFRCDANVSVRPFGQEELGTKAEIKNLNSFSAVERAIKFEIDRQTALVRSGQKVKQETRLWDENSGKTHSMRSKEGARDYRYFPEPDLVPLHIDRQWVASIEKTMPELPEARRERLIKDTGLPNEIAVVVVERQELATFFDEVLALGAQPGTARAFLDQALACYNKNTGYTITESIVTAQNIKDIVCSLDSGEINTGTAKTLMTELMESSSVGDAEAVDIPTVIKQRGLAQMSNEDELRSMISAVIAANPKQVEEFKAGKQKVREFFLGQVMKQTKGKANPKILNQVLDEELAK
ncbi:MAG: Asp-tRNA(Asn)/Glu-tRNA(Gln) amidotransferase subunit GatB [Candidatus Obscuribacterales bacterium]|nr:Asp-tRNA(Asn)/Glu-tRNA(Gln) amidotransferase subunit GatB [Candidatus Obscuribacterales bacterium]